MTYEPPAPPPEEEPVSEHAKWRNLVVRIVWTLLGLGAAMVGVIATKGNDTDAALADYYRAKAAHERKAAGEPTLAYRVGPLDGYKVADGVLQLTWRSPAVRDGTLDRVRVQVEERTSKTRSAFVDVADVTGEAFAADLPLEPWMASGSVVRLRAVYWLRTTGGDLYPRVFTGAGWWRVP